jgi:hypothetical protein
MFFSYSLIVFYWFSQLLLIVIQLDPVQLKKTYLTSDGLEKRGSQIKFSKNLTLTNT